MARARCPIVFLLGPSGAGKSTLAQWLAEDAGLLHLEIDRFPGGDGIELEGLRDEWNMLYSGGSANPLVATIRSRVTGARAAGAVLSFPSLLVLPAGRLNQLSAAGVTSLVLYGSAAACLDSFLEQEVKLKRAGVEPIEHWFANNQGPYFQFSRPEFAPFRLAVFRNGERVPRSELVEEVRKRAAA